MLCESCSQIMGEFHKNGIVLIISHLSAIMDSHIEKVERLKMDAVKAKTCRETSRRHKGVLYLVWYLPDIDLDIRRPIHQLLAHYFAWSNEKSNTLYLLFYM